MTLREKLDEEWNAVGVKSPLYFLKWADTWRSAANRWEATSSGLYWRRGRKFAEKRPKAVAVFIDR